jgi:2-isopropylmalate synthase
MLMRKSGAAEHFRVLDYTVSVSSSGAAQASVEMEVGSEQLHEISRGVGPVHALDLAIRKALGRFYDVKDVCLKNYRVRILNQEKATAASVEVFIEFSRNGISWSTVGISDDIIRASGQALIKGYEYYLLRCERK